MYGLMVNDYDEHSKNNENQMQNFLDLAKKFNQRLKDEKELTETEKKIAHVGMIDTRKPLKNNIVQNLGAMTNALVF